MDLNKVNHRIHNRQLIVSTALRQSAGMYRCCLPGYGGSKIVNDIITCDEETGFCRKDY